MVPFDSVTLQGIGISICKTGKTDLQRSQQSERLFIKLKTSRVLTPDDIVPIQFCFSRILNSQGPSNWIRSFISIFFAYLSLNERYAANSVANVQAAIEHIFPLVYEFRKKRPVVEAVSNEKTLMKEITTDVEDFETGHKPKQKKYPFGFENDADDDIMCVSDMDDDDRD